MIYISFPMTRLPTHVSHEVMVSAKVYVETTSREDESTLYKWNFTKAGNSNRHHNNNNI